MSSQSNQYSIIETQLDQIIEEVDRIDRILESRTLWISVRQSFVARRAALFEFVKFLELEFKRLERNETVKT